MKLEDLILAHRHLYYSGDAAISDYEYDRLEQAAKLLLPESSPVHDVGGESRDKEIIKLANAIKDGSQNISNLTPHMI